MPAFGYRHDLSPLGEADGDRGSLSRGACDVDLAFVLLDDRVTDGETESGTFADRHGREEWVEDVSQIVLRDPAAVVGHGEDDEPAFRVRSRGDFPVPIVHGVRGVQEQVRHDLLERSSFPQTSIGRARKSRLQVDARQLQLIRHKIHGLPHNARRNRAVSSRRLGPRGGRIGADSR